MLHSSQPFGPSSIRDLTVGDMQMHTFINGRQPSPGSFAKGLQQNHHGVLVFLAVLVHNTLQVCWAATHPIMEGRFVRCVGAVVDV